MKLIFLGTRGYIDAATDRHRRHTATLVEYRGKRVMIDCGEDWLDRFQDHNPQAVVLTHCHPDHAWGLKNGASCPVYASAETWESLSNYPIEDKRTLNPGESEEIRGIKFTLFPVEHSTRCPAGGFRIQAGRVTIFYVPDVVYIHDREAALSGCKLYVGDGATIEQSFVRKPGDRLIGHTPLRTQLTWCQKEGVPRAVFTHLGSEIVEAGDEEAMETIRPLAEERGVAVQLAVDGMGEVLR
jgi:phosphoribosyl 1,2-cyclic phosphodiesterase